MKPGDIVQNMHGWQGRVEQVTRSKRFGSQALVQYASVREWENQAELSVIMNNKITCSIWQSTNNGLWCVTRHQGLTADEAARQLARLSEDEAELRKTRPENQALFEIRPNGRRDE